MGASYRTTRKSRPVTILAQRPSTDTAADRRVDTQPSAGRTVEVHGLTDGPT